MDRKSSVRMYVQEVKKMISEREIEEPGLV